MATPKHSESSLSSTLAGSTHSRTPNSFASIVGQYVLMHHWKPRSRTEQLWDKAVKTFYEKQPSSSDSYTAFYHAKSPENILSLLSIKLEECKKNRTTYKGKDGTDKPVADALYKIAIYFKRFTGLVGTAVSIDPVYAAGPWMIIQFFLDVALRGIIQFGALIDGLEVIGRIVTRYGWIEKIYLKGTSPAQKDLEECILKLYTACLKYFDKAYNEFVTKRSRRILNAIKAGVTVEELLLQIEDAESEVQKVFTLVEAEDLRQRFSSATGTLALGDSTLAGPHKSGQRDELCKWLKAVTTIDSYQNALKSRTPGTNSWIFEQDTTYKLWIEPRRSPQVPLSKLLWIHGSPGFGKTILSATIIEKLTSQQEDRGSCLAYFFCSSGHEERRSPTAILRSWVTQIICSNDKALKIAYQVYLSAASQSPDESDLWKTLRLIVTLVPCILVMDGFDECIAEGSSFVFGTRNRKSQFLQELGSRLRGTDTRVLITSRPHEDIKSVLHDLDKTPGIHLYFQHVGQKETTQDLLLCSRKIMTTKLFSRAETEREDIALQAAEKSDGMILYLNLLCQGLHPGDTTQVLRKTMSEMPQDLDFLYERELKRILNLQEYRKKQALAILRWVLFATRPLTVRELAEALVLTSDENEGYYPYDALPRNWDKGFVDETYIDAIITNVGSLVQLRRDEEDDTLANQTVHLIHASVREYLLSPAENKGLDLGLLDQFAENDHLARLCLRYLCYGVFNEDYQRAAFRQRISKFPFLFYATVSWYNHARSRKLSLSQDLEPDIERLFNSETRNWQLWSQIFEGTLTPASIDAMDESELSLYDNDSSGTISEPETSIQEDAKDDWDDAGYANSDDEESSAPEDESPLQDSIKSVEGTEQKEANLNDHPTQLYYAALLGLTNLIKSLKAKGLDCNASGGHFGFPLQAAIEGGYSETITCLLDDPDIDINKSGGFYGSAISAAAAKGMVPVVKRLLDMKARTDLTDSNGCSPLYFACTAGQTEIAELLLKQNKELATTASNDGITPIVPAVVSGKVKLVVLLRRYGGDINAKDEYGVPLLSRAISYGHQDIAKDLVLHRVDLENSNDYGITPLNYAAYYTDEKVIRLLISHKANLHAVDKGGDSVMHWACRSGSVDIVKLLIERNTPFDMQNSEGFTPLHFAAMSFPDIVPLLLDAGSNIDAITLGFRTPLILSVECEEFATAKLLVERYANANVMGTAGDTALKLLLKTPKKSHDAIRCLLDRGDVYDLQTQVDAEKQNSRALNCITPLAIYDKVVDKNTTELMSHVDGQLQEHLMNQAELDSALLASIIFNSLPLVEAFLQRGSRISCRNMHMQTPLHLAVIQEDCGPMVDLLLRYGASAGARDSVCCTPIHVAVSLGKPGLPIVEKLLPTGGLFDDFDDSDELAPSEETVKNFVGKWDGYYKYSSWSLSDTTPTSIIIEFFESRSPDKWHLPWFRYEGKDGGGFYLKYGFVYKNGKVRFLKMYDHHGWYSEGQLEVGTAEDEGTLLIKGRWGESDERFHGSMEFKKVVEDTSAASEC